MTVDEVTSGGAAVSHSHKANRLELTLPSAPEREEQREFTVKYHGVPAVGLNFVRNKFGERCFFSTNWPDLARQWLPIVDHPYDKATSEFIVTAPAQYQVVANGLLVEDARSGDGRRTTHWKQSVPIATWLNCIGVAQFAARHFGTAAGVPLQTWVFPQDREAGIATLRRTHPPGHRVLHATTSAPTLTRNSPPWKPPGIGRRHGTGQRDLLRRALHHRPSCYRPGGPRDCAPMVRRFRHRKGLGRCLAERGLRHLFRPAGHRAL